MLNEMKYRRWAWGALIGLAAVVIIAGLIMAMTLSTPKPTADNTKATMVANNSKTNSGSVSTEDEKTTKNETSNGNSTKNDTKTETKSETSQNGSASSSSTQQNNSGSVSQNQNQSNSSSSSSSSSSNSNTSSSSNMPKTGPEEYVLPIIALAVSGYLIAYNAALFKKNA